MEESTSSIVVDGRVTGIQFGLATGQEICTSSNSDCPINHASQLSNPFLGLPLQTGKCESCGTAEPGQCEGHFGYIELPIPIYHPCHVSELKRMLSLVCLKCLKMKNSKIKNIGIVEGALASCCPETSQISINEVKTTDGTCYLELKLSSKSRLQEGFWNFLDRYGFHFGDNFCRSLLPSEVMVMLRKLPEVTRRKLAGKGYFPQDGYILQYLPVPPNCLSVPDISDGITVTSSDLTIAMLKKVLKQAEIIKSSRSGIPNFESHEVEANDLQAAVLQYLQVRGTAKSPRDVDMRYGISKDINNSSTKAWLEKMKTLFIRKGSGFSSRSVITGDPYKRVDEIGLPFEIAQMITFEERVSQNNINHLQKLVDEKLCLTYRDGFTTYSLREGSKGHTFLRPGQVVHRRIMDGDLVFVNRPPTTHKHSLQALSVYVHEDHTVKINPLICGPLSADFDGDCVHLFYPQSLAAKAEVLELFSVENQLLSSHSGNLNLQMATDSILSVKMMFKNHFLNRASAQQLAMFVSYHLPKPALLKAYKSGPLWTALEILQTSLPSSFDCSGERHLICKSEILKIDYNRDIIQSVIAEILTSIFAKKGPHEVLKFFNALQPLLMENLFSEGFSVSLEDFNIPKAIIEDIQKDIQDISPLLFHLRSTYNELVELQLENHLRVLKIPITNFILKSSAMGNLIDSKSDSAITKVVQQIGFLGLQLSDKGKFYSKTLVGDMASLFQNKYPFSGDYPAEEFGLVRSCLFHGLDPYQEMVHSIYSREIIVRSSRGLTEPGTLFKNLMAILRDVVICYDGTVRNVCSNAVIQFEYGIKDGTKPQSFFAAGEPVGVLAATAMSNPAYKAVLDSSPSSNSSWEMMKEILLCAVNFKNDLRDRRVILYLNDCDCGRKYCRENAAHLVKNQLKKVSLKDTAVEFLIEYNRPQIANEISETDAGLVGHVHLNKIQLKDFNISMLEIVEKCQETINLFRKKKKGGHLFKRIILSYSECCCFQQSCESKWSDMPCLKFSWQDMNDHHLERTSHVLANTICPVLLETIVKGDPRVCMANIIWITPDRTTWIRNASKSQKGELALDVVLEREAVKQSGDAWRIVLDSCLPVLHLIDTRRSIPYAIKQVQELLGISCAFEQAIQRLSTSVTMVAKGVLKEHLILLANSMTCAGSLIGFNMGGIKSLSRALNVQVPFTEATLFTPKKCFERAAEKCHVDRLSSIVASCAWGKHVAVGTGSRFEVLWNTKEVELNQEEGTDVYSFLHLVRGSSNGEEPNSACLGAEIDYLDSEVEDAEMGLSPEHNSGLDKPTFEDSADFEFDLGSEKLDGNKPNESNWGRAQSQNVESTGGGEWVVDRKPNPKPSGWSGWGNDTVQTEDIPSTKEQEDSLRTGGWNGIESGKENQSAPWGASGKKANEANETGWTKRTEKNSSGVGGWNAMGSGKEDQSASWSASGKKAIEADETGWNKRTEKNSSGVGGWNAMGSGKEDQSASWAASGKKANEADETGWNKRTEKNSSGVGGWNAMGSGKEDQSSSWAASGKKVNEADETGWNKRTEKNSSGAGGWNAMGSGKENPSATWAASGKNGKEASETVGGWNAMESGRENQSAWAASGKNVKDGKETGWNKSMEKNSSGFGGWKATESGKEGNQLESWADRGKKVEEDNVTGWSGKGGHMESWKGGNQTESQADWGKKKVEEADTVWSKKDGNMESGKEGNQSGSWASWGNKVEVTETLPNKDGGPQLDKSCGLATSAGVWSERAQEESPRASSWNAGNKQSQWGPPKQGGDGGNESDVQSQWGSQNQGGDGGNENNVQWGHQRRGNSRGWGSSNAGEFKNKGNRPPPKSFGGFNDDSSGRAAFTATRQRLDMFESAEQDVLLDVEQIMLSIRRIMHQSGYNDGDPLSADDQRYILDNVFNHHPDKAVKMGAGVDYVMVNKHSSFQESRCFYIVSTDGHQEDFSYRKSLDNYIRGKYPETAESFIGKYFKKPRSAGNPDRSPALDRSPAPAPDRSPALALDRSPALAPDRSPAPEEAGLESRQ